jgi:hypothetical protein
MALSASQKRGEIVFDGSRMGIARIRARSESERKGLESIVSDIDGACISIYWSEKASELANS